MNETKHGFDPSEGSEPPVTLSEQIKSGARKIRGRNGLFLAVGLLALTYGAHKIREHFTSSAKAPGVSSQREPVTEDSAKTDAENWLESTTLENQATGAILMASTEKLTESGTGREGYAIPEGKDGEAMLPVESDTNQKMYKASLENGGWATELHGKSLEQLHEMEQQAIERFDIELQEKFQNPTDYEESIIADIVTNMKQFANSLHSHKSGIATIEIEKQLGEEKIMETIALQNATLADNSKYITNECIGPKIAKSLTEKSLGEEKDFFLCNKTLETATKILQIALESNKKINHEK